MKSDTELEIQHSILKSSAEENMNFAQRLFRASKDILLVIDLDRVRLDAEALYGACTTGASRIIPMAIQIQNRDELLSVLKIARENQVAVYPTSSGKNWGYGTSNPVENFCILLDLSRMNKILDFNADLGTLRIEPGVTQAQLQNYMKEQGYDFLVPSTGAGPHASLMGNLLERGFGITPHADHFGALLALEAVLATGEIYRSTLSDAGCEELNQNFKWGLGPYLDGLFAQSGFGIVTQATIALMRRPQTCEAFIFTLKSDVDLTAASEALKRLSQNLPGVLGGMNLMNAHRMLAMSAPYPTQEVASGQTLNSKQILDLRKKYKVEAWTGIGGLYGTRSVVHAAKKEIRKILKPFAKQVKFVSPKTMSTLNLLTRILPTIFVESKLEILKQRLQRLLDVVLGNPTEAALPLAYWRTGKKYIPGQNHNIAQDNCGLIWYSPLVINQPESVQTYVKFVRSVCKRFGMEPLITLTTLSERVFDSTIPLLFNRQNQEETRRAQACYQALLKEGQALGYFPYRLGIEQMDQVTGQKDSVSWQMVAKIKRALDPQNIISPGRYSPLRK